jgi:uncharacterized protein YlzI (FlbEa/FlbD family)
MATLITLTRRGTNISVLVNPDHISFIEDFADGGCQIFLGDGPAPYVAESLDEVRSLVAAAAKLEASMRA